MAMQRRVSDPSPRLSDAVTSFGLQIPLDVVPQVCLDLRGAVLHHPHGEPCGHLTADWHEAGALSSLSDDKMHFLHHDS